MKIGIITNNIDNNNSGIGRYTSELVTGINRIDKINDYIFIHTDKFSYSKKEYKLPFFDSIPKKMILGLFALPIISHRESLDILHDPGQVSPFFYFFGKTKKILTIHDISHNLFPDNATFFSKIYSKLLPIIARKSDKIITVSDNTKKDIIKHFKISAKNIKTIYLAADKSYKPLPKKIIEKLKLKYSLNFPYILYVGTLEPRKNIPTLLKAFSKIKDKIPHKLVITGKKGWKYDSIFKTLEKEGLQDSIIFTDYVEEKDLPGIYNGADLFVYPSLYEGFGLPPLEAMQCGCPVITSNSSSLPEVVGDAGILIDPENVEELAKTIFKVATDKELRERMIKKGFKQSKKFCWEKCAKETLKIYEDVMKLR